MKEFILLLISLIGSILLADPCKISSSNGTNVSKYEDCQVYSTSSSDKLCCYVKGADKKKSYFSLHWINRNSKGSLKRSEWTRGLFFII